MSKASSWAKEPRKIHHSGGENPRKPRELSWRLNITYWWKCVTGYKHVKQMLAIPHIRRVWMYFCLYYCPVNWGFHSSFTLSARAWVGNGSPFTQPYSALNKINKAYLSHILCKGQFFLLWKKENLLKKKKHPQINITDISKNLLLAFEIREEQQSLYCFESGRGKISLLRIYFYSVVFLCHCLDLPFLGSAVSISQIM